MDNQGIDWHGIKPLRTTVYRKKLDDPKDDWHYFTECPNWPTVEYLETDEIDKNEKRCTFCMLLE
ncbi:MAG TPA: hypothetical protein VKH62_11960 [Candidatus Binatia bacterium]|nr:hypothetical protein [Candidatus Binatia bacterium]